MAADSLQKQRQGQAGRLFQKGASGSPGGCRLGSPWQIRSGANMSCPDQAVGTKEERS